MEPDSIFRVECNISYTLHNNSVQWYQSNKPILIDNRKYFLNSSHINRGILFDFSGGEKQKQFKIILIFSDTVRHILIIKGLSLPTDSNIESQEIYFICSATNSFGTSLAETSILLRSK